MPKSNQSELLIYGDINSWSSANFIKELNEVPEGNGIQVSVNTNGGDPQYGFGIIRAFSQFEGEKHVQIDGKAYSWGSFFPLYAEKTVALDTSKFLFHRAAYPSWFESSDRFTAELQADLKSVNDDLERAMRNKLNVELFENETGVKIKEIFSMDDRKDVYFTAAQAKRFGLVQTIVKITPKKAPKVHAMAVEMAAKYEGIEMPPVEQKETTSEKDNKDNNNSNSEKMTAEEFKVKHPEAYNAMYKAAHAAGVKEERDRATAYAIFAKVDPEAVKKGIESGEPMSVTQQTEFIRKEALQASGVKLEEENPKKVTTDKPDENGEKTAEQKAESALDSEMKELGHGAKD